MTKKDVQNLLKAYESLNADKPDSYPLSFHGYVEGQMESWGKRGFETFPIEKKVNLLLRAFGGDLIKIYEAFQSYDMEFLNDVLFEIAQRRQMGNILSPGMDHTYYSFKIMPELLAANMSDRIGLILPKENGSCTGSVAGTAVINLFMAIWYKDKDLEDHARMSAEKQLAKKNNVLSKAYISYLLAILNKDPQAASEELELICVGAKKSKEWGENEFTRGFAQLAHSMYNLQYYVYDGELADSVKMPQAGNFCQDLAIWQREHAYRRGNVRYYYPEMFDVMNKIMLCTPPKMYLIQSNRNTFIDTARFEMDVVATVKEQFEKV